MIIPDVNLLLYAVFDGFKEHAAAKTWWEGCVNDVETVGMAPVVIAGFVRLATSSRVFENPLRVTEAGAYLREWVGLPTVEVLTSGAQHVMLMVKLVERVGTAGNLATDAQIAAHAAELRATVYSNDADFGRFPDVDWVNPLAR